MSPILRASLCCAAAVVLAANAAAQGGDPPSAEEPQGLPKAAVVDRPLRVVPSLMGYDRIVRDLSAPITDEARREELKTQVARLWDGYNSGWQRIEANEIQVARMAVSELNGRQPPSAETLRSRMADALAAVNRSDSAFFLALSEVVPPESREALESLKRARTRAICGHGMAPQLAFAVPFRLVDPMRWLDAATVEVPDDARREYDARMTALVERWSAARRAFEFQALARGRGSKEFEAMLPSASRELLTISQTMGGETAAEVARLSSALPPAEVARIQIARIEAIYFDTPRPERPAVLDALPTDPTAHDAWIAERERTLVADAEILLRYEKRAIETMFAAPFSSRGAYDTRRTIADPFREERTRLHDEAAARQKVISGAQPGGG
ncbi:MAG: hypothetical protein ACO3QC_05130 [Phycisphaerales bacterium]